jgi:hypothetical protein
LCVGSTQFVFEFCRGSQLRTALNLRGDFEFGLLNSVGTVKAMGTLGAELNEFYIMRWT